MYGQIADLPLQAVAELLRLLGSALRGNDDVAQHARPRGGVFVIDAVFAQRKRQHIRHKVDVPLLVVNLADLLVVDDGDVHLGILRKALKFQNGMAATPHQKPHARRDAERFLLILDVYLYFFHLLSFPRFPRAGVLPAYAACCHIFHTRR